MTFAKQPKGWTTSGELTVLLPTFNYQITAAGCHRHKPTHLELAAFFTTITTLGLTFNLIGEAKGDNIAIEELLLIWSHNPASRSRADGTSRRSAMLRSLRKHCLP